MQRKTIFYEQPDINNLYAMNFGTVKDTLIAASTIPYAL